MAAINCVFGLSKMCVLGFVTVTSPPTENAEDESELLAEDESPHSIHWPGEGSAQFHSHR